ncbi:hypothetical protein [Psychroflexus salis]|uniref:Uncharacterized protein n=1 Tax=Psychroflexus salis TaxID=1526574 RepID=A0A917EA42_9FLAO|nr:hypothetical protein [Psychroflexus salis]GGE14032.1 hypothetical protein GCM10010831_14250 [Psychroflexus salis]
MKKKRLAFILKFCSPNQIYIVDETNQLDTRICPFKVKVKRDINSLKKNQLVIVESVKVTESFITVFIINGKPYYYYHFEII